MGMHVIAWLYMWSRVTRELETLCDSFTTSLG